MTEEQKEKKLKERLKSNYEAYIRTLQAELPPDLIDQAAEIAAAKLVYQELQENGCPREFVDYLLRFENPLEMVRDMYLREQDLPHGEEFYHLLCDLEYQGTRTEGQEYQEREQEVAMC